MNLVPTKRSRHLIDPELVAMVDAFPVSVLTTETLDAFRALVAGYVGTETPPPDLGIKLMRRMVAGPAGAPEVGVAIYRPAARTQRLPTILQIHGGGFVAGQIDVLEARHRALAAALQCCLVSVDYRLAPETPFPGAVEDCYAALEWLVQNAEEIGIAPYAIGLLGESAGGGLAAALALLARDRARYPIAFQHLIYPMLDDRTAFKECSPFAGEFIWTNDHNRFGWTALLGDAAGRDNVSQYAAAARATDLTRLPPTFIMTGALDLFADESIEFARRLVAQGVPTELHVYPGAFHGFDLVPSAKVSVGAREASLSALKSALQNALNASSLTQG